MAIIASTRNPILQFENHVHAMIQDSISSLLCEINYTLLQVYPTCNTAPPDKLDQHNRKCVGCVEGEMYLCNKKNLDD